MLVVDSWFPTAAPSSTPWFRGLVFSLNSWDAGSVLLVGSWPTQRRTELLWAMKRNAWLWFWLCPLQLLRLLFGLWSISRHKLSTLAMIREKSNNVIDLTTGNPTSRLTCYVTELADALTQKAVEHRTSNAPTAHHAMDAAKGACMLNCRWNRHAINFDDLADKPKSPTNRW